LLLSPLELGDIEALYAILLAIGEAFCLR